MLFDNIERTYTGPSFQNEPSYAFFSRSARPDISVVRNKLEEWFASYPNNEQKELKNRFIKDFDSAFYELFLYSLFSSLNYEIEIHPKLSHSAKRPDFLISKDGQKIYIEAKLVTGKTNQEVAHDKKVNVFYDNLNKTKCNGFFLQISELNFKTISQPTTKKIIAHIESEAKKYNHITVAANGFHAFPKITYEDENISVVIKLLPMKADIPLSEDKRPIGMFPVETWWGGGEEFIVNSIIEKSKRYGKLEKPYIICLNLLNHKIGDQFEIDGVIWGNENAYTWASQNQHDREYRQTKEGIFRKSSFNGVTGILATKVYPFNVSAAKYWLYKNPFARNSTDFSMLNLNYYYVSDEKIKFQSGNKLSETLCIPEDWISNLHFDI